MVNVPKERKTYCKGKKCKKHTVHKVTQYKSGKASGFAQGKRRYDRKQAGASRERLRAGPAVRVWTARRAAARVSAAAAAAGRNALAARGTPWAGHATRPQRATDRRLRQVVFVAAWRPSGGMARRSGTGAAQRHGAAQRRGTAQRGAVRRGAGAAAVRRRACRVWRGGAGCRRGALPARSATESCSARSGPVALHRRALLAISRSLHRRLNSSRPPLCSRPRARPRRAARRLRRPVEAGLPQEGQDDEEDHAAPRM